MFVEEGFRIRFANGEVIDFYADSTANKEEWMKVLSQCVGKDVAGNKGWTEMVLDKERREKTLAQGKALKEGANGVAQFQPARPRSHEGVSSKSVPSSPVKGHSRTQSHAPTPPPKNGAQPKQRDIGKLNRRDQVRSMIF